MGPRSARRALAGTLAVMLGAAGAALHGVLWVPTAGALAMAAGWRRTGAAITTAGALGALAMVAGERASVAAHFGADTLAGADEALRGTAVAAGALIVAAAALGFAPERAASGWARRVADAATIGLWLLTAWLGSRALSVHTALAPLSEQQLARTWGPALAAALCAVFVGARAHRATWIGALLLPLGYAASAGRAPVAAALGSREVAGGRIVHMPAEAQPWRGPSGPYVVSPGRDALPSETAARLARSATRVEVVPGFAVPTSPTPPLRVTSALQASGAAPRLLARDWTAGPARSPESIRAAVGAGAAFLARNQQPGGRFTYIVKGPSGESGAGYNYPRHAGTAWFLARAARALDDTRAADSARAALAHLDAVSETTADGRAFVLDPTRKDGKAWIGTTALAVLAARALDEPREQHAAWARQVIASVDADGQVRGEVSVADGAFVNAEVNAYGQGQVMLALAALAPDPDALDALGRAAAFVGGPGYYGAAHPLWVGDEHWMCLAAHGLRTANAAGAALPQNGVDGVCATYAAAAVLDAPPPGAGLPPAAGPAAGAAEAIVARAWDTGDARLVRAARDYATYLLSSQYQPDDLDLLPAAPHADRLIGAFRDGPYALDVQIDAVQHIGGALLGVLALDEGADGPGRLP